MRKTTPEKPARKTHPKDPPGWVKRFFSCDGRVLTNPDDNARIITTNPEYMYARRRTESPLFFWFSDSHDFFSIKNDSEQEGKSTEDEAELQKPSLTFLNAIVKAFFKLFLHSLKWTIEDLFLIGFV